MHPVSARESPRSARSPPPSRRERDGHGSPSRRWPRGAGRARPRSPASNEATGCPSLTAVERLFAALGLQLPSGRAAGQPPRRRAGRAGRAAAGRADRRPRAGPPPRPTAATCPTCWPAAPPRCSRARRCRWTRSRSRSGGATRRGSPPRWRRAYAQRWNARWEEFGGLRLEPEEPGEHRWRTRYGEIRARTLRRAARVHRGPARRPFLPGRAAAPGGADRSGAPPSCCVATGSGRPTALAGDRPRSGQADLPSAGRRVSRLSAPSRWWAGPRRPAPCWPR